jgi:hypothetical protein
VAGGNGFCGRHGDARSGAVLGIVTTLVGGGVAIYRGRRLAWWIAGPWLLVYLSGLVSLIAAYAAA